MDGGVQNLILGSGSGVELGNDAAEASYQDAIGDGEDLGQI